MSKSFSSALAALLLLHALRANAASFHEDYERALHSYKQGRYAAAIVSFQAAYDQRPLPRLLYNIGLVHMKLGDAERALFFFRLFLQNEPNPPPALRAEVERRSTEAEALLGRGARAAEPATSPLEVPPAVTVARGPSPAPHPVSPPRAPRPSEGRGGAPVDPEERFLEPDWDSKGPPPRALASVTPASSTVRRGGAALEGREGRSPAEGLPEASKRAAPRPPVALPPPLPLVDTAVVKAQDGRTRFRLLVGEQPCLTPCALQVSPGPLLVQVQSPRRFAAEVRVPRGPVELRVRRLTTGPLIAGAVLTPLGLLGTGFGVALVASPTYTTEQERFRATVGIPMLVLGGGALLAGLINLALIRGDRVTVARMPPPLDTP